MNQNDDKQEKLENENEVQKRPYVKPGIVSGKAFETMALSCARASDAVCNPFQLNS